MPRAAREQSKTGIYAVLIKGDSPERRIFLDDDDYNEFIMRIDEYMDTAVMAFALCERFICLIIKEDEKGIGQDIRTITTSYSRYYGQRYGIKGGIFEQRFRSVPIETPREMARELACVHSLCDYAGLEGYTGRYVDDELLLTDEAMELLGDRGLYDEAMKAEDPITYFYSWIFKPRRRYNTNPRGKQKQSKEKAAPIKEEPAREKAVPIKEEAAKEEPKPTPKKKKNNMPSWLL